MFRPKRYLGASPERESVAYRGYLIRVSPFSSDVTISKDGAHIATASSVDQAKATIDEIA